MSDQKITSVNIRPEVSILSILKSVNYKPWYAIGEFVDNAIQSAIGNLDNLKKNASNGYRLEISIRVDPSEGQEKIVIRDNAAGIGLADFPHAFRPAAMPLNREGLSEFGMGMKSAACWFSDYWTIRTKALGEPIERTIVFDIEKIIDGQIEEISVQERPARIDQHYTEITLTKLNQNPQRKTVAKIKSHLTGMYRVFLREGFLDLSYNDEVLMPENFAFLSAPHYKKPDSTPITWKKDIHIQIGNKTIWGYAAILGKAKTEGKGFTIIRRNRVIIGSDDDGYKPQEIFGAPNSFLSQRLIGELHIEGFDVSHTKDGIQWGNLEEKVIEALKKELNKEPICLLDQGRNYRARNNTAGTVPSESSEKLNANGQPFSNFDLPTKPRTPRYDPSPSSSFNPSAIAIPSPSSTQPNAMMTPLTSKPTNGSNASKPQKRVLKLNLNGEVWTVKVQLSHDPSIGDWLEVSGLDDENREIDIVIALSHPFVTNYCPNYEDFIDPLIRLAASISVAEIAARNTGVRLAGNVRRFMNQLLRDGFDD